MRLSKNALQVYRMNDPKSGCDRGVHVETDGSTVATDGHRLMVYKPSDSEAQYKPDGEPIAPFELPTSETKRIAGMLKGPWTGAMLDEKATNANGTVSISAAGAELRPEKLEGQFPKYPAVIPAESTMQDPVGIDVGHLLEIVRTLKYQGFETIRFMLAESSDRADKAILMTAENSDGKATVVLMPKMLR